MMGLVLQMNLSPNDRQWMSQENMSEKDMSEENMSEENYEWI